jgi:hypothetical protein
MALFFNYVDEGLVKNIASELLNLVGKYREQGNEYEDVRLYKRESLNWRAIIDNTFPSMLVVDFTDIEKELRKYNDLETNLRSALKENYEEKVLANFKDTKLGDEEIALILDIIKGAVAVLQAGCTQKTSHDITIDLENALYISTQIPGNAGTTVKQSLSKLGLAKYGRIYITDTPNNDNRKYFLFSNFAVLSNYLRELLKEEIKKSKYKSRISNTKSVSEFLQFGHVAVGWSDKKDTVVRFNSPKLLNIIFTSLAASTQKTAAANVSKQAALQFATNTDVISEYITVEKDFGENIAAIFIRIGGNVVKFENALINEKRGFITERKSFMQSSAETMKRLSTQMAALNTGLGTQLSRLLIKGKSSDSLVEHIAKVIVAKITQKTAPKTKTSSKATSKTVKKRRAPVIQGFVNKVVAFKAPPKLPVTNVPVIDTQVSAESKLTSLQNLLNGNLVETVKRNMGQGSRRDILNLRSGRFAESVKVERLTQSRAGMITAFYNYMRNPYATFSEGGKQQTPRSRDPKLLISKSIREVAAQAKITRLRAVLI